MSITSLKANVDLVNLNVYEIEKKEIEISFMWILHYHVHMISFNILIRECSFYCINWWLSFWIGFCNVSYFKTLKLKSIISAFHHRVKPYINISTNKNKDWEFIKTVETIENSNNVSMLKYGWEMSFSAKLSIANEMMTVFISRAKNFMFHLYDMSISMTLDAKKSDYYTLVVTCKEDKSTNRRTQEAD